MPGPASRIAATMPSPAIRVASRSIAISRGLFTARSALTIGSRFLISDDGAAAFSLAMNVASRESRPSQGSCRFAVHSRVGSPCDWLPRTSAANGV